MGRTQSQIVKIISKKSMVSVAFLRRELGLSSQIIHRHLLALARRGVVEKIGQPPKTQYRLTSQATSPSVTPEILAHCRAILSAHPAVRLVTLFGSQARGEGTEQSDIDLLVWVDARENFNRQDIWQYWDRQALTLSFKDKVSLVVRKLSGHLTIDTLLLDLPEEHIVVHDAKDYFAKLRTAVIDWRKFWGSEKIPAFGGKHAWRYSNRVRRLSDIDFRLELKDVP